MDTHQFSALPGVEASVVAVLLPRCPHCGHKHPKAYSPPLRQDDCPQCGTVAAQPRPPVLAEAHVNVGGVWGLITKAFLHTGAWLRNLAKRI